jgi:hypothetical protein
LQHNAAVSCCCRPLLRPLPLLRTGCR